MSLKPRNKIYHCDFTVNGQRVRQTLETTDKREAIQLERDLIARAREGKLASGTTAEFSRLPFGNALDRYLAEVSIQRPGSVRRVGKPRASWEGDVTNPLRPYFGQKRLNHITADDIRGFQAYRLGQGKNPNTINHEVKALLRLLKRAKLLNRVRDDVKLLPVKKVPRQMLTPAEKQRLFETAAQQSEWQTAYCAALLTANTTMRPVELKRLKWADVDPFNRLVTVRVSKTDAGARVIPLNDEAYAAVMALKGRSDALNTYAPESFVFHRQWPVVDPLRPMTSWRSAWRTLRKEAAKEDKNEGREAMTRLASLRFYDLRHQVITEMLEAGIPEGVIREVAGHVDPAMTRHYSHPRLAAKRAAVGVLGTVQSSSHAPQNAGYVTTRVTKALPAQVDGG